MVKELILKNRSCRRFYGDYAIDSEMLRELVDCARLSASGANLQPLKYILSCDPQKNSLIFSNIAWAGYLKEWPGPEVGERPSAYIIILGDRTISPIIRVRSRHRCSKHSSLRYGKRFGRVYD